MVNQRAVGYFTRAARLRFGDARQGLRKDLVLLRRTEIKQMMIPGHRKLRQIQRMRRKEKRACDGGEGAREDEVGWLGGGSRKRGRYIYK
jgi:hypothetical protein